MENIPFLKIVNGNKNFLHFFKTFFFFELLCVFQIVRRFVFPGRTSLSAIFTHRRRQRDVVPFVSVLKSLTHRFDWNSSSCTHVGVGCREFRASRGSRRRETRVGVNRGFQTGHENGKENRAPPGTVFAVVFNGSPVRPEVSRTPWLVTRGVSESREKTHCSWPADETGRGTFRASKTVFRSISRLDETR